MSQEHNTRPKSAPHDTSRCAQCQVDYMRCAHFIVDPRILERFVVLDADGNLQSLCPGTT